MTKDDIGSIEIIAYEAVRDHLYGEPIVGNISDRLSASLASLRARREVTWGMAASFVENRDAHGVMDMGAEIEALDRAIAELEKLAK